MKKFTKQITAILTAVVMAVSAAGISASAKTDAKNFTGWVNSVDGWQYLSDGSPYESKSYKIDGIVYDFSHGKYCNGKYTDLRTEDGVKRRYTAGACLTRAGQRAMTVRGNIFLTDTW